MFFSKKQNSTLITLDSLELTNNDFFVRKVMHHPSNKSQVVVADTHSLILIKDGQLMNTLESGRYPVYDKDDKKDIANVEFIYMSKTCRVEVKWGTPSRFDMLDPITDIPVKIGARGTFEVQIDNPRKAYLELIGADKDYNVLKLQERLRSRMCSEIQPIIAKIMFDEQISYDKIAVRKKDIADSIKPALESMFKKDYGLKLYSFVIDDIAIDDEYIKRIESELNRIKTEKTEEADRIKREELERSKFDEEIRREYEIIKLNKQVDDIEFERKKWLAELQSTNYAKYLRAVEVIGGFEGGNGAKSGGPNFCSNCGHSYEHGTKFCPGCGIKVSSEPSTCPKCNATVAAGSAFCSNCGQKL